MTTKAGLPALDVFDLTSRHVLSGAVDNVPGMKQVFPSLFILCVPTNPFTMSMFQVFLCMCSPMKGAAPRTGHPQAYAVFSLAT
jgi:hypothetical protein